MIVAMALLLAKADACLGSTKRDVEQCRAADFPRADADLGRNYGAAVKRLTEKQRRPWLSCASEWVRTRYRDAECGAVYERWKGGTIRGTFSRERRIRLTQDRTMAI